MNDSLVNALMECLQNETAELERLFALLEQETEMLSERKYEQLESISAQKQAISACLEKHTSERLRLLDSQSAPETAKSQLHKILSAASQKTQQQIQQLNENLQALLQRCRAQNTVNGQVISANMNLRQELLDSLSAQTNPEVSKRYTATGAIEKTSDSGHHQEV
ncbi:MAG: flagellar protein FlgN [Legionellaceae bacterium]|nr:flagellar protein FlgN [Legionellaceae bacterium]